MPTSKSLRPYTSKQMGDACEMLVAAELTLAGIPALKVPDNWPGYDVIAQPPGRELQRVSVKSRTFKRGASFLEYNSRDEFEWLAMVLLPSESEQRNLLPAIGRKVFIIPRALADEKARQNGPDTKSARQRYWRLDEIPTLFAAFESNFGLHPDGPPASLPKRRRAVHS